MTDEQQEPRKQEIDLTVRFAQPPPRPAKVHRVRDTAWILVACGIIGAVFRSSIVFGVVFCAAMVLYIVGGPVVRNQR